MGSVVWVTLPRNRHQQREYPALVLYVHPGTTMIDVLAFIEDDPLHWLPLRYLPCLPYRADAPANGSSWRWPPEETGR